jgi:phosphatidylglycerol:prolipoprotein diacylglycerol transferase
MHPILFEWRGRRIYSYPAMLYLGLVLGVFAGNVAANQAGLDAFRVLFATLLLTIPALAGSRLLFIALHWEAYRRDPRRILRLDQGGGVLYGGLLLLAVAAVPVARLLDLPLGPSADVLAITILVAAPFARIGCLLHGCCSGRLTGSRIGLVLPDHRGHRRRRIPSQLLEAGWMAVLLLGAVALWGRLPFPGALALYMLGGYGLARFALDFTRETAGRSATNAGLQRAVSLGMAATSLGILVHAW